MYVCGLKLHVYCRRVIERNPFFVNNRIVRTKMNSLQSEACNEEIGKRKMSDTEENYITDPKRPRNQKKKKVAMLLSYCGQGYLGMQINNGFKTIEGELFEAFLKLGIMDEESFKIPQSIHFQRAARTDKGVSVSVSLCSF